MSTKIKIDDTEYDLAELSSEKKSVVDKYIYASNRLEYLNKMIKHLERAKESYINNIKAEVLSNKAGLFANMD